MIKLAVFVSGRGSNLRSILNSIDTGSLDAKVELVVSDKTDCPAFEIAAKYSIKHVSVSIKEKDGFIDYNQLIEMLSEFGVGLIVLAGFLKKIPDELIDNYPNKIINIHPALLPSFGGKGMYGIHVHEAVFSKSCQVSGVTVHFVDKIYDNGKIIAQEAVDISEAVSPEEIAELVLKVEHNVLPEVIKAISEERVEVVNNRIRIIK